MVQDAFYAIRRGIGLGLFYTTVSGTHTGHKQVKYCVAFDNMY